MRAQIAPQVCQHLILSVFIILAIVYAYAGVGVQTNVLKILTNKST